MAQIPTDRESPDLRLRTKTSESPEALPLAELPEADAFAPSLQSQTDADGSDSRQNRIATTAYWRAEKRGFEPGRELDDWLSAEREVDGES